MSSIPFMTKVEFFKRLDKGQKFGLCSVDGSIAPDLLDYSDIDFAVRYNLVVNLRKFYIEQHGDDKGMEVLSSKLGFDARSIMDLKGKSRAEVAFQFAQINCRIFGNRDCPWIKTTLGKEYYLIDDVVVPALPAPTSPSKSPQKRLTAG